MSHLTARSLVYKLDDHRRGDPADDDMVVVLVAECESASWEKSRNQICEDGLFFCWVISSGSTRLYIGRVFDWNFIDLTQFVQARAI